MAKLRTRTDLTSLKDPAEWQRHGSQAVAEMGDTINGGLEFDKNFASQTVTVNFKTANVDVAVPHTLGKTGVNYLIARKSSNCTVYDGATMPQPNKLWLRSSAPGAVVLVLY